MVSFIVQFTFRIWITYGQTLTCSTDSRPRITSIISFVSGSLRPVKYETDSDLSAWYKKNSRIYVAAHHACWENEEYERRVKKSRFGKVVRSGETTVNRMLDLHFVDATKYILESVGEADDTDELAANASMSTLL